MNPKPSKCFRILHTSDWHLGVETGTANYSRAHEHAAFLDWLLTTIVDHQVDAVLVSGDIYHTGNAPIDAQRMFFGFLRQAADLPRPVDFVVTGGNHDNPDRLALPGHFLDRIRFVGDLPWRDGQPDLDRLIIPLEPGAAPRVVCLAFPFLRAGDLPVENSEAAMGALWRAAADRARMRYPSARLVGTAHLFAAGGDLSDTERLAMVGGVDCVSINAFPTELTYLALGHLHRPQKIKAPFLARYAGNVLPMSATERNYKHSIAIVDIPPDGPVTAQTIEIPSRVPFLVIPAQGEPMDLPETLKAIRELQLPDVAPGFEPFLEIKVRPREPIPTLGSQIAEALAGKKVRLLGVFQDCAGDEGGMDEALARGLTVADLSPTQVFERIHTARYGDAPSPDLAQAFERIVAEATAEAAG